MSGTEKEFIFSINPGKSLFLKDCPHCMRTTETYIEPPQTSKMEIFNGYKPLTIFAKRSRLEV